MYIAKNNALNLANADISKKTSEISDLNSELDTANGKIADLNKEITKKNLQRFLHQTKRVFVLNATEEKAIGKTWEDRLVQCTFPQEYSLYTGDIVQVHIDCVQDFTLKGCMVV